MDAVLTTFVEWAKRNWQSPLSILGLVTLVGVSLVTLLSSSEFGTLSTSEWALVAAVAIILGGIWFHSNRIPRHPKGIVGFGIALSCEADSHLERLRNDFIAEIVSLAERAEPGSRFSVLEFPQRLSKVQQTHDWACKLAARSRSHILLYGRAAERIVEGKAVHALRLDGLIRHGPTTEAIQQRLGVEFREILPERLLVDVENDLIGLELSARFIELVARFIVGNAAAITGDLDYARRMYLGAQERLGQVSDRANTPVQRIAELVPVRLGAVYGAVIKRGVLQFWRTWETADLAQVEDALNRLLQLNPRSYVGRLARGIFLFIVHHDVANALESIVSCREERDTTWCYSAAFLEAYQGNLDAAYAHYKHAFYRPSKLENVPVQAEEFIEHVLRSEPDRTQLWFCLGLINERAKKDRVAAIHDYEQFVAQCRDARYQGQRQLVEQWLNRLREEAW